MTNSLKPLLTILLSFNLTASLQPSSQNLACSSSHLKLLLECRYIADTFFPEGDILPASCGVAGRGSSFSLRDVVDLSLLLQLHQVPLDLVVLGRLVGHRAGQGLVALL